MASRSKIVLFWCALAGVCALFFGRFLTGAIPVGADLSLVYAPFFAAPWDGGPPLWNPWALGGTPLITNLQAALLYPPRWPFFFVSDWRVLFGPFHFAHHFLACATMVAFLRGLGIALGPTFVGAFLFGVGGHMAGRIINPTIFYGCCWLPLLLYGALGASRRHLWTTTLAMTMIFLTGSPHAICYGALGYGVVLLCFHRREERGLVRSLWSRIWCASAHVALAFLLAAPGIVPGVMRAEKSIRTLANIEGNLNDSITFAEIPEILLGGTGGLVHPEYIDKTCYVGAIALLLILAYAMRREAWRDRRFRCGAALTVLGLFFALGRYVGLQWIMPWVPGFRQLVGPARAIVLSATGFAMLGALAFEALGRREPKRRLGIAAALLGGLCLALSVRSAWTMSGAESAAQAFGAWADWLRAWAIAPDASSAEAFFWLDAAMGLGAMALLIAILVQWRPGWLAPALAVAILLQLWHFYPRVAPPTERFALFDPPPQARFLLDQAQKPGAGPFRVVGYDALRLHDSDYTEKHRYEFLTPNLASLYRLEDIQGFDPLILLDYVDLIARTAGRSPINDPMRNLEIAAPSLELFDLLGVRYLVGQPYDRRLTTLPTTVTPRDREQPVGAWQDAPTSAAITHWNFVSLLDGAALMPIGREVARLEVEAEEGRFSFPVRNGIETADMRAPVVPGLMADARFQARIHSTWSLQAPEASLGYRMQVANYRGRIDFGRPLHVRSLVWRLIEPRMAFVVTGQGYRLARPEAPDDPWRLVHGSPEDAAPVFEYRNWQPRAVFTTDWTPSSADANPAPTSANAELHNAREGAIRWLARLSGAARLEVEAPQAGLLVLREQWAEGWRARVDGETKPILRVNGCLRGIALEPGRHEVAFAYRPILFLRLAALSSIAFIAIASRAIWLLLAQKRRLSRR